MSLTTIVQVVISRQTSAPSRAGFGVPMLLSNEASAVAGFTERARIYTDVAGLTTDGFATGSAAVAAATRIFSQNPRPTQLVVGRRANLTSMSIVLTVSQVVDNTLYRVTINGTDFDFTSGVATTDLLIATGLVSAINLGSEPVTALDNVDGTFDLDADVAGEIFTLVTDRSFITQKDGTVDPGVVADLTAIRTAVDGNDDWYALHNDNPSAAETLSLAAQVETLERIFGAVSADDDILAAPTTDVGGVLAGFSYIRTFLMYHPTPGLFPQAGWTGVMLPKDPGSATWMFKTVVGIADTVFTPTELTNLDAKNVNRYIEVATLDMTEEGRMAGGLFIDETRGIDFIVARIRENAFGALKNADKISYEDDGINIVVNEVWGVMGLGISQSIFTNDPAPTVTAPRAKDVSSVDRGNRLLPDINFSARLAGAIHAVQVNGIVTV